MKWPLRKKLWSQIFEKRIFSFISLFFLTVAQIIFFFSLKNTFNIPGVPSRIISILSRKISEIPIPTEKDLHRSDYGEIPPNAREEDWYLSEIWKPWDKRYDFQILNFYYDKLIELFKFHSDFYPYIFKLDSKRKFKINDPVGNNPTHMEISTVDRSYSGLTIKKLNFRVKYRNINKKGEWSKSYRVKFTFKYPIRIKKSIYTWYFEEYDLIGKKALPYNADWSTVDLSSKIPNWKKAPHSPLDIDPCVLNPDDDCDSGILIFLFLSKINFEDHWRYEITRHLVEKHTAREGKKEYKGQFHFSMIQFSYLFVQNFHYREGKPSDHFFYSSGQYLMTELTHDPHKDSPYSGGKWKRPF